MLGRIGPRRIRTLTLHDMTTPQRATSLITDSIQCRIIVDDGVTAFDPFLPREIAKMHLVVIVTINYMYAFFLRENSLCNGTTKLLRPRLIE